MRAEIRGDSLGHAAPRWGMTRGAASLRSGFRQSGRVLRVVKLRLEAFQCREFFERRVLLVEPFRRVADCAQWAVGRRELCLMATDAVFMLRESGLYGVVAACVADGAAPAPGERRVRARIRV